MKSPLAISTFLALLVVLASANPTADLKLIHDEAIAFTNSALTFAHKLVGHFPHTPEATEVAKSIKLYSSLLHKLKSNQSSHLIGTITTIALTSAQVHLYDHRLRHPTVAPIDAKNQILHYARYVHKNGAALLKQFPQHFPANQTVKAEMDIASRLIKGVEAHADVGFIIPPVTMLIQGDLKIADIARHYQTPLNRPDDHTKVHTYAEGILKFGVKLHGEILAHAPEAKEVEKIVGHLKHQLHLIESQETLTDIVGTIATLVRENDVLVAIAKKLGKPTH